MDSVVSFSIFRFHETFDSIRQWSYNRMDRGRVEFLSADLRRGDWSGFERGN